MWKTLVGSIWHDQTSIDQVMSYYHLHWWKGSSPETVQQRNKHQEKASPSGLTRHLLVERSNMGFDQWSHSDIEVDYQDQFLIKREHWWNPRHWSLGSLKNSLEIWDYIGDLTGSLWIWHFMSIEFWQWCSNSKEH